MKSLRWSLLAIAMISGPLMAADDAAKYNRMLGRGINLGNALEAPSEGEWGLTLKAEYFDRIKEAGFDHVRIPVRWETHTGPAPDFKIDPSYFERIDWAVDQALSRGMVAVINSHHDDSMIKEPGKNLARLQATWRQIATRYKNQPDRLFFELLNEPNGELTDGRWDVMFKTILAVVRESNPDRIVIVGPGHWNNVEHLRSLEFPENDRRLIATFHYYLPFQFTHQGAEWAEGSKEWLGRTWTDTPEERGALTRHFEMAAKWGKDHGRPIYVGEFGAYSAAPMDSRARWTAAVAREAERLGMSWSYWEFASGFGAFDKEANAWRAPLKDALVPPDSKKSAR
ncbi:glycoside hydrolase family 5 protein [Tundrisphaera lichenicola]|uniref:glycoside hydrolase family 5 protein n=1 Tax=Tundrisphaera lichenicola TaxID=2029860 RepID=UPI003EBAC0AE